MAKLFRLKLSILLVLLHLLQQPSILALGYTRGDFPSDFIFGSGTSAFQVEGAASEDGRTPSIFDTWALKRIGDPGNMSCDEYHKYKEDVQLMVDTRLDAYRFSISWTRLIPNGRGPINQKGLEYYNNLIDELIKNGIQPHATLLHLDHPQALEDAYGGWMNPQIVKDFTAFAEVCFKEFGDRVLHWSTMNEPNALVYIYYDNSPYIAAHNLLLGHASVVKLYREKFQEKQHGLIGITLHTSWFLPETNTERDLIAYERVNEFANDWIPHPLVFGDYPNRMKQYLGKTLPSFTGEESKLVKGSFDFFGVNCYAAQTVKDDPTHQDLLCMGAQCTSKEVKGAFVQGILEHFKQVYGNPLIFVHENGFRTLRNASMNDSSRIDYLKFSIGGLLHSIRNGSNVKGYFQWSFMDLIEFAEDYKYGFGLYYVDVNSPELKRYPRESAHWYSNFLKGKRSNGVEIVQLINNSTTEFVMNH